MGYRQARMARKADATGLPHGLPLAAAPPLRLRFAVKEIGSGRTRGPSTQQLLGIMGNYAKRIILRFSKNTALFRTCTGPVVCVLRPALPSKTELCPYALYDVVQCRPLDVDPVRQAIDGRKTAGLAVTNIDKACQLRSDDVKTLVNGIDHRLVSDDVPGIVDPVVVRRIPRQRRSFA